MKSIEIKRVSMVSYYPGEPKFAYAKATGDLVLHSDHVEFYKVMGNSLGSAFGLIGMAVARSQALKDGKTNTYQYSDIANVRETRYMGMTPMLVLDMKDGSKHSFTVMNSIRQCADIIRSHLQA